MVVVVEWSFVWLVQFISCRAGVSIPADDESVGLCEL